MEQERVDLEQQQQHQTQVFQQVLNLSIESNSRTCLVVVHPSRPLPTRQQADGKTPGEVQIHQLHRLVFLPHAYKGLVQMLTVFYCKK